MIRVCFLNLLLCVSLKLCFSHSSHTYFNLIPQYKWSENVPEEFKFIYCKYDGKYWVDTSEAERHRQKVDAFVHSVMAGEARPTIPSTLPEELCTLIEGLLDGDAEKRPSMQAVYDVLEMGAKGGERAEGVWKWVWPPPGL